MPDRERFTETMAGSLPRRVDEPHEDAARTDATPGLFVLTVVTPAVKAFLADPERRAPVFGCLIAPAPHPAPRRPRWS